MTPGGPTPQPGGPADDPSQPPAPPAAQRRNTRLIVGIIVAIMVLVGAGVGAWYFLPRSDSPTDAVEAWLSAVKDGDLDAVLDATCAGGRGSLRSDAEDAIADPRFRQISWVTRSEREVDANTAEVRMSVTGAVAPGRTITFVFTVVKESGDWKVCDANSEP